jgi:hypothetical protein
MPATRLLKQSVESRLEIDLGVTRRVRQNGGQSVREVGLHPLQHDAPELPIHGVRKLSIQSFVDATAELVNLIIRKLE